MGNALRHLRGESQKNIVRTMDALSGRYSRWEIWQDFIIMSAASISNVLDKQHREEREKLYLERAAKYKPAELEQLCDMFFEMVAELDRNPDQDFLGELFMSLGLGNEWKGQFFTPYSVCRMMAAISMGTDLAGRIDADGWVSVNDPACGAGALLIAFANECLRQKVNYQTSVLFVAQDVDFLAGCMCYIQMSLLGLPGYVVIDNTLTKPSMAIDSRGLIPVDGSNVWYTPMYFRDIWQTRKYIAQLKILFRPITSLYTDEPEAESAERKNTPVEEAVQLTLF